MLCVPSISLYCIHSRYPLLSPQAKRIVEAYTDAYNYYGLLHQDELVPFYFPMVPEDMIAALVFVWYSNVFMFRRFLSFLILIRFLVNSLKVILDLIY